MAQQKTVTVNGRSYDAVTGLPISSGEKTSQPATKEVANKKTTANTSNSSSISSPKKPISKPAPKPAGNLDTKTKSKPLPTTNRNITNSEIVHSKVQRSQTLLRRATKKPAAPNKPILKRSAPGRHMDIARSASISRFAKHPVVEPAKPVNLTENVKKTSNLAAVKAASADKPARIHPLAKRALSRTEAKKPAVAKNVAKPTTAKQVKDAEISKALSAPSSNSKKPIKAAKKSNRKLMIVGAIILVILIGLFTAWKLIPGISVGVAATQAGIQASYPEYTPDGYSLSQPVSFSDGEVILKFTSNSNDNFYTVTQTRSSWDSSAVLDNVVAPTAGANYVTTKERGLTIYTWDTNAAWVNGGILYKIDSKAPLTGDQIRRIATSL